MIIVAAVSWIVSIKYMNLGLITKAKEIHSETY